VVDGTGSGSCPGADFGISCVEPSSSATRVKLISMVNLWDNKPGVAAVPIASQTK
jgi:hypothetical protein